VRGPEQATIGVVIATRDRCASLQRVLDHLRALPERPPIVVVDNASRDSTAAMVAQAKGDVKLIRLERDLGAAARTAGVRALDTEAVAFSDDDSWWSPGSLARAAHMMRAHPRLGLIASRILVGPEERLDPTCRRMAQSPLPCDPGLPGRPVLGFVACGAIVRRAAYLEVGGFEPRLGIGGEEQLLALDLAAAGWGLAYVSEIVAHHHPTRRSDGDPRHAIVLRNAIWSTWLRRSPRSVLTRTIALTATGVRDGQLRALFAAIQGLPWALRQRRVLPREVERAARMLG
jgi:GT2 family glycosyltransferase